MIEDASQESLYNQDIGEEETEKGMMAKGDVERLFDSMPNKRYVHVIRRLVLEGWEPEQLAREMNITTANLYNIKRRAMVQLTNAALKDIKEYGK